MGDKSVDLFHPNFKLSHLTSKNTSHQIRTLKPGDKNVELRVIVLCKKDQFVTKNQISLTSFVVADSTGSITANFYNHNGRLSFSRRLHGSWRYPVHQRRLYEPFQGPDDTLRGYGRLTQARRASC